MAPRTSRGLLLCSTTSSLVLLCVGLAIIAVGIILPGQVHNKLQDGVRSFSRLQYPACTYATRLPRVADIISCRARSSTFTIGTLPLADP
jgi:hypothetical protein